MNEYKATVTFFIEGNNTSDAEDKLYDELFSHFEQDQFEITEVVDA